MKLPVKSVDQQLRDWNPTHAIVLFTCYFVLFGVIIGVLGVLWAEIITALQLSEWMFGAAQTASPTLSILMMLLLGRIGDRSGKKPWALMGCAMLCVSMIALAEAGGIAGFVLAQALIGVGTGLLETAMNSVTMDWERATQRDVMNLLHASFSLGAVLGAFGAGMALANGATYQTVLFVAAALSLGVCLASLPIIFPPRTAEPSTNAVAAPASSSFRLVVSSPLLIVFALLAVLGVVGESVANNWSVIYLRSLGAESMIGGAAFGLFNIAMLAGRIANAPLVARAGVRTSLLTSGSLLVLSSVLLLLPANIPLAIASLVLAGLGVAGVIPTALSAAARLVPGQSGAITAGIMSAAYAGFIFSPPLIGWIADLISLQVALLLIGVSGIFILWLALGLRAQPHEEVVVG